MEWVLLVLSVLILGAAVAAVALVWKMKGQIADTVERAVRAEASLARAQVTLAAEVDKTFRLNAVVKELTDDLNELEKELAEGGNGHAAALRLRQRLSRGGD